MLKRPRFLRRETGVRSGWVAGPSTEPPPCSRTRGPKAEGAERSFRRGPSVGDNQHRGRGIPEEGRVRRNPKLPVPVGRGGAKVPSRGSIGPSHCAPCTLEKTPLPPPNSRSQPCSSSYCAPFEERSRKSEKLVSGRNEVFQPLKQVGYICQTQITCFQHFLKFQRHE